MSFQVTWRIAQEPRNIIFRHSQHILCLKYLLKAGRHHKRPKGGPFHKLPCWTFQIALNKCTWAFTFHPRSMFQLSEISFCKRDNAHLEQIVSILNHQDDRMLAISDKSIKMATKLKTRKHNNNKHPFVVDLLEHFFLAQLQRFTPNHRGNTLNF